MRLKTDWEPALSNTLCKQIKPLSVITLRICSFAVVSEGITPSARILMTVTRLISGRAGGDWISVFRRLSQNTISAYLDEFTLRLLVLEFLGDAAYDYSTFSRWNFIHFTNIATQEHRKVTGRRPPGPYIQILTVNVVQRVPASG